MRAPRLPRPRLLPALVLAMAGLAAAKLPSLLASPGTAPAPGLVAAARADNPPAAAPAPAAGRAPPAAPAPPPPAEPGPEQRAERALLEGLRARRAELEAREGAAAAREMVLAAAEQRLGRRIEELAALQRRLEAAERARSEREEAGWRQMAKLYEGMRPRDAAAVLDELEMPVLVELFGRMRDAKAAPVLGAMRPERARQLTAELARLRARPAD